MHSLHLSAVLVLASSLGVCPAFAQGSLIPPGAPAPTMKTLAQIEPRTPLGAPGQTTTATIVIDAPGSYVLVGPVAVSSGNGITINADGVTLDLGGFTVSSSSNPAAGIGIYIAGIRFNVVVRNGIVRGSVTYVGGGGDQFTGAGFADGVVADGGTSINLRVENVTVSGTDNSGIVIYGDGNQVFACDVTNVGGVGIIAAVVRDSKAVNCGGTAVYGNRVEGCFGRCLAAGNGVQATTASGCYGVAESGNGVTATAITNCTGFSTTGRAIDGEAVSNCRGYCSGSGYGVNGYTVTNCYGYSNSGIAIFGVTVSGCFGISSSGPYAILSSGTASYSTGTRSNGIAISASIAVACTANAGTISATNKYLMP